jgi:hypothetical protein
VVATLTGRDDGIRIFSMHSVRRPVGDFLRTSPSSTQLALSTETMPNSCLRPLTDRSSIQITWSGAKRAAPSLSYISVQRTRVQHFIPTYVPRQGIAPDSERRRGSPDGDGDGMVMATAIIAAD